MILNSQSTAIGSFEQCLSPEMAFNFACKYFDVLCYLMF
jgi:hypothetical protein